jgi:hypothetical protein
MSTVSHQTIKLSKGKHSSPEDGACVMELASMLAGEAFTDHPACVCPAIGSFLRAYNDSLGDERRQDLYEYASRVVGTHGSSALERVRAERLIAWASARRPRPWARLLPERWRAGAPGRRPSIDAAGTHAVHSIRRHTDESHVAALALVDELLAMKVDAGPGPEAAPSGDRPVELVELSSAGGAPA